LRWPDSRPTPWRKGAGRAAKADRPDKGAIVRKHGEVNAIREKQQSIWIDFRLQAHAVLTPEQRATWAAYAGSGPGLGGGFGRGHGRGFMRGGGFGPGQGPGPGGFGYPDCPMRAQ